MEVTLARKLLSYWVSFMLLYVCKYSYDVHRHRTEWQKPVISGQNYQELPSKTISPEVQKQKNLQSEKLPFAPYVVKDGKTELSITKDTEFENDEVKSSPKTNPHKEAK